MKVGPGCLACIFDRAKFECDLAFDTEKEKMGALQELLEFAAEHFGPDAVPAVIGTERYNIIKRRSSNADIYAGLKDESNEAARELLPIAEKFYEDAEDKMEALIRIMTVANSMEYGVRGHSYDHSTFHEMFQDALNEGLVADLQKVEEVLDRYDRILYLTDNAGEIVFDLFVISELEDMGKEIILAPKEAPVLNDATAEDVRKLGYKGRIVPTSAYVGVSLDEASDEFLEVLWNPEYLILAKGMGHYETISEFENRLSGRLLYVFRAKCESVANSAGVDQGVLVAKVV